MENFAFALMSDSQKTSFRQGRMTGFDVIGMTFVLPQATLTDAEEEAVAGLPPRLQAHWRHVIKAAGVVQGATILGVWFAHGDPSEAITPPPADPFAELETGVAGGGQEWARGSGGGVVPGCVHASYSEVGPMTVARALMKAESTHWVWCSPVLESTDLVRGELRVLDGADFGGAGWYEKYDIQYFSADLPATRARFDWAAYNRWCAVAAGGLIDRLNAARAALWPAVKALATGAQRLYDANKPGAQPDRPQRDIYTRGAENCISRSPLCDAPPVRTRNFRRRLQRELALLSNLPVFAGKLPKGLRVATFDSAPREDILGCWAPTRNTIRVRRCAPDLARIVLLHEMCHILGEGEAPVETDDGEVFWTSHGPAFQSVWSAALRERYPDGTPECVLVIE